MFVFSVGLIPIYLIVESRINEEKRLKQRPVERLVLDGVLAYAISIVRIIGIYANHNELEPKLGENDAELTKKTELFAKKAIEEGLHLPQSSFQKESAIRFTKLCDDLFERLFSLQSRYPFVIEEYPDVATILGNLEAKQSTIKSAFYWSFLDTRTSVSEYKQLVERALIDIIRICDELAEASSKRLEHIAEKETSK